MSKRILVICGPTASGKTGLAIDLARRLEGEIVSADSMQIYRRLEIGTAKPTPQERQAVPHYMLDVAEPGEQYSVSRYVREASHWVEDILARGKLPIVCGGTGLYIDGLIRGEPFPASGADTGLRERLEQDWREQGPEAMLARLERVDPESARRLPLGDRRRILRALEVYEATGTTMTEHNRRSRERPPRYDPVMIGLTWEPRELLYQRIDRRVDQMLELGLEEEVRQLQAEGLLAGTAAQAIGYKEMLDCFRGEITLEQAASLIRQKSRNYAKRQLTWFRRDPRVHWINGAGGSEKTLQEATNFLRPILYNDVVKS